MEIEQLQDEVRHFMQNIEAKNPHETEFLQAVPGANGRTGAGYYLPGAVGG